MTELTVGNLDSDMVAKLEMLSDAELGHIMTVSARRLRIDTHAMREVHRRMVQHCLDVLAERGRAQL